jgi:hypothetical protein
MSSITKKVLVDFIQKYIHHFNGELTTKNFNKRTKAELFAIIALKTHLYDWFLQETNHVTNQTKHKVIKCPQQIEEKYITQPLTDMDIELEKYVNDLEVYEVFRLLENGANPNILSMTSYNSLLGNLLFRKVNTEEERTTLLEIVELLLHYGATCDYIYIGKGLPTNIDVIEFILKSGVHPDKIAIDIEMDKEINGWTLLRSYLRHQWKYDYYDFTKLINLLVSYGADVMKKDEQGDFPLLCALQLSDTRCEIVHHMLLHSDINLTKDIPKRQTLFLLYIYTRLTDNLRYNDDNNKLAKEIMLLFIQKGLDVNEAYNYTGKNEKWFLLSEVLKRKMFELAEFLIENGALIYDIILENLNGFEEGKLWLLKHAKENSIEIITFPITNDKSNTSDASPCRFECLPNVFPDDIKQYIWNIKEQIEEIPTKQTFVVEYTIPYITHYFKALLFQRDNSSHIHGKLDYCESFNTESVNYSNPYRFKTTFSHIANLDEAKINYFVCFLRKKYGAINICHNSTFIMRHSYCIDVYNNLNAVHILQKINQIVNKCAELVCLKGKAIDVESYKKQTKNAIMNHVEYLKNSNQDNKYIFEKFLQTLNPYRVLVADGIDIIKFK